VRGRHAQGARERRRRRPAPSAARSRPTTGRDGCRVRRRA
jgi:hypothetical protein